MATRTQRICAGAIVAATIACAHAPPAPKPLPLVVWPEPPAAPRLRLVAVIPSDAPPPRRSFWQRLGEALTGSDPDERSARRLVRPFGVAVAPDGTVYVADPDLPGVLRVSQTGDMELVTCRSREWAAPMAVALGDGGELWVADAAAAEIVVVPADRKCRAIGTGALDRPTGVAVAGGRVVVADPPRHQLAVFSRDGALLARWGSEGDGLDQLHFPTAVAAAADAGVLVVDALNFRIVRLARDGRAALAFGQAGEEGGAFARPKGVAVDSAGRVYVADAQRDLVLVYDAAGTFEYAAGASGSGAGSFQHPAGLAVVRDRLYVADSQNGRIQVFEIVGGSS